MILSQPEIPVPLLLRFPLPGLGDPAIGGWRRRGPVRAVRGWVLMPCDTEVVAPPRRMCLWGQQRGVASQKPSASHGVRSSR